MWLQATQKGRIVLDTRREMEIEELIDNMNMVDPKGMHWPVAYLFRDWKVQGYRRIVLVRLQTEPAFLRHGVTK